ncbi:hypothetical protein L0222_16215 [bacterium]|nr:hypothetical protein [bacterium]MCI0603894.1 hypothetical protein [bacterium]
MSDNHISDDRLIRYLLGDLLEADQLSVETEFFQDDVTYEKLLALEDELMYDYLSGKLPLNYRARFQERFLTSKKGQNKLEFAKALNQKVFSIPEAKVTSSKRNLLWALAAVLVLGTFTWLILQILHLQNQFREVLTAQNDLQQKWKMERKPLPQNLKSGEPITLRFLLKSGRVRSSDENRQLLISSQANHVRLELDVKNRTKFKMFRVVLRNAGGQDIWSQEGGSPSVNLPAKILATDDYELSLSGSTNGEFEEIADYYFSVMRK